MSEHQILRVCAVRPETARVPSYATDQSAGLDLYAALDSPITLSPRERKLVPTGIAIALPKGHEGQVRPRSGLAMKHGVTVLNAPGTIDEDFRGELCVLLVNFGDDEYVIANGDRIAQLVVAPVSKADVTKVETIADLGETDRGNGGFGSTGR